jgi:hypothetical protein
MKTLSDTLAEPPKMYESENDISEKRGSALNALMNPRLACAVDLQTSWWLPAKRRTPKGGAIMKGWSRRHGSSRAGSNAPGGLGVNDPPKTHFVGGGIGSRSSHFNPFVEETLYHRCAQ